MQSTHEPQPREPFRLGRRQLFGLAGGAAAGAFLSACGTGAVSSDSTASAGAGGGGGGGNLTVWANAALTGDKSKGIPKAAADFGSAHGITVDVQGIPTTDLVSKLTTTVGGGAGPDVAFVDVTAVPQLAAGKVFADITSQAAQIQNDFLPDALKYSSYQGKQYAIPYYSNAVGLFTNNDMMSKAGISVPKTWQDLRSAAMELTGGGKYGYMMGAAGYGAFLYWPWLWQNGGQIVGSDGVTAAFNDAAGQEAWEFYANLAIKDKVAPPEYVGVTQSWDAYVAPFVQGKVAMMATGPWAVTTITKGNPDLKYTVSSLPKGKQTGTVLGGASVGISSKTQKADLAWQFVQFMTSAAQVSAVEASNNIPSRKDIASSDWVKQDPVRVGFAQAITEAKARPTVPSWGGVEFGTMADAWDSVIQGKQQPLAALAAAATAATAKLKS